MNTGIRRFILRVAVGLLAFLLGVAAAWALGGLNPFQSYSGERSYRRHCGHYRSWSSTSGGTYGTTSETFTIDESGRSCKTKRMFSATPPPPPPPPPVAPAPLGGS